MAPKTADPVKLASHQSKNQPQTKKEQYAQSSALAPTNYAQIQEEEIRVLDSIYLTSFKIVEGLKPGAWNVSCQLSSSFFANRMHSVPPTRLTVFPSRLLMILPSLSHSKSSFQERTRRLLHS